MRDILDLLDGLKRSRRLLGTFVQTIPGEAIDRRRNADCWTIGEHVSHLAQVQPMLLERLERFRDEDHPEFVPFIPGQGEDEAERPAPRPIDLALDQFGRHRDRQVALLTAAREDIWAKKGSHPEYKRYSTYILVRHILMHDHWHMYRMEELWLTRDAYLTKVE
jgi:uncharacterized damage-inducible protein DinB